MIISIFLKMKDKFSNIRIGNALKQQFEDIIKQLNITKSNTIRTALNQYIYMKSKTVPAVLWSYNELIFLIKDLNDEKIKQLAEITSQNTLALYTFSKSGTRSSFSIFS